MRCGDAGNAPDVLYKNGDCREPSPTGPGYGRRPGVKLAGIGMCLE